jgi:hypothetical protein
VGNLLEKERLLIYEKATASINTRRNSNVYSTHSEHVRDGDRNITGNICSDRSGCGEYRYGTN